MVLCFWLEPGSRPEPRGHRSLREVANFTKVPLPTLEKWSMPRPDTLLRTRYEESPPYGDTAGAPLFDTDADGEITDGDEADTVYTAQVITDRVILIIFGGAVTAPRGEVTQPRGTVTAPPKIIFEIVFHAWPFPVGYY
jgi:hypothetical protein